MTSQVLRAKNSRVVAVCKSPRHAVYVKDITKFHGYNLDCMNSWGAQDPNPQIPNRDISSLHYISLYMDKTILVTSAGPSAEHQGDMLGLYKDAGTHNNCHYYKQVDTERTDRKEPVIYRSKEGEGGWVIGPGLDGATRLKNESNTESVPLSGWSCRTSYDIDDPYLRITPDLPPACGEITITASGDAAVKQPTCVGVYTPTLMFSAGRRVFKHQTQERYLLVPPGYDEWGVRERVETEGAKIASCCAPSMCPADPRAGSSRPLDRTSWVFKDQTGDWIQGNIKVKCSVHKN